MNLHTNLDLTIFRFVYIIFILVKNIFLIYNSVLA